MIQEAISGLVERKNLTPAQAEGAMSDIMEGNATNAQIAAFLVGLRLKGETIDEITACAKIMRSKSISIHPKVKYLVDTCGTGGDNSGTFNISTAAAFVAAGAGANVAKHGNKSVSSKSGSADVLAALGVNIELQPQQVEKCIEEAGMGFMFAPFFHPAMKHASAARKEIGVRTIFNILGPLTNPANSKSQLVGVFDEKLLGIFASVLKGLGSSHVIAVNGHGLDEITISGSTKICELKGGEIKSYEINPSDFGFKLGSLDGLKSGSPQESAEIIVKILKGEKSPRRDIVLLNAAAALLAAGIAKNFEDGILLAVRSVDSGSAMNKLEKLKEFTNRK